LDVRENAARHRDEVSLSRKFDKLVLGRRIHGNMARRAARAEGGKVRSATLPRKHKGGARPFLPRITQIARMENSLSVLSAESVVPFQAAAPVQVYRGL